MRGEIKGFPFGESCPRSGLMRGGLALLPLYGDTTIDAPLIRPCGATFPKREGMGFYSYRSASIGSSFAALLAG